MGINPLNLLKLKDRYKMFKHDHPEMSDFGRELKKHAMVKGTRLELKATTPDGKVVQHEITLTDNDVEMVKALLG